MSASLRLIIRIICVYPVTVLGTATMSAVKAFCLFSSASLISNDVSNAIRLAAKGIAVSSIDES